MIYYPFIFVSCQSTHKHTHSHIALTQRAAGKLLSRWTLQMECNSRAITTTTSTTTALAPPFAHMQINIYCDLQSVFISYFIRGLTMIDYIRSIIIWSHQNSHRCAIALRSKGSHNYHYFMRLIVQCHFIQSKQCCFFLLAHCCCCCFLLCRA